MADMTAFLAAIQQAPLVPVVTIERAEDAVPLAEALANGGIRTIELTLRTEAGMEAIRQLAQAQLADMLVGVGTLAHAAQLAEAADAGARFFVSPGGTPELFAEARARDVCLLAGVVTPSEILAALQAGQSFLKFFPAGNFGGIALLKQYAAVFPQVRFCPTGGVSKENAKEFLALPNVRCVGGSWLTPPDLVAARDWPAITRIAKESLAALG